VAWKTSSGNAPGETCRPLRCAYASIPDGRDGRRGVPGRLPPRARRNGGWIDLVRDDDPAAGRRLRLTDGRDGPVAGTVPQGTASCRSRTTTFRDRPNGRTPRSERGDRGSSPCPGALFGRVAQQARALVLQTRGRWFDSSLAHSKADSSVESASLIRRRAPVRLRLRQPLVAVAQRGRALA
jgi:hypothetical protein